MTEKISIHALREEGDSVPSAYFSVTSYFYPRPPRGGRRIPVVSPVLFKDISIHALREEGDLPSPARPGTPCNFYPRPPRGGRLDWAKNLGIYQEFLSTPSARRATWDSYRHSA